MPSYDFRCKECRHVCEVTRPGSDDSPVPCPVCGGETKQVFHPVGVHFKGSGFHNTDYKRAGQSATEANAGTAPSVAAPACPVAEGSGDCSSCPAAE